MFLPNRTLRLAFAPAALAALLLPAPSAAQQPEMGRLAGEIAAYLSDPGNLPAPAGGGKPRAVVVPFSRDGQTTQLGAALAGALGRELARASGPFEVANPEQVRAFAEGSVRRPRELAGEAMACWLAGVYGASYAIRGALERQVDSLRLRVRGVPCAGGARGFDGLLDLPATPELLEQLAQDSEFPGRDAKPVPHPQTGVVVHVPGKGGVGYPSCVRCPDPPFTPEARARGTQGVVVLRLVINAEGRAENIHVLRGLPHGLTAQAMETIRKWVFQPARDAQGNPVAAWVAVEVVFRLLDRR